MTADDFEDRLRAALQAGVTAAEAAAGGEASGDRAVLVVRSDRRRRQRRVGAAAAVLVVAGAVATTWSVGRDDRGPAEQVAVDTTQQATGEHVTVSDDPLPVVERPELTFIPMPSDGSATPSAPLFVRTLPDGSVLSVRGNRYTPPEDEAPRSDVPPWWEPPDWCVPTGDLFLEAVLPEASGRVSGERRAAALPGAVGGAVTLIGVPADEPTWVALAQVDADAALVRATFPGGETDEMAPVDGLVALMAPAADGLNLEALDGIDDEVVLTAFDATGAEVGRTEVDWVAFEQEYGWWMVPRTDDTAGPEAYSPYGPPACTPPTDLPAPGAEQPADPAAAEAGVRATWDAAFGQPTETPTGDLFDDPTGLGDAEAAFRDRQSNDLLATVTVPIDAIVFADAETAYVEYRVNVPAIDVVHDDRFAVLVLEDGTWKVTRDSVCALLSIGGGPVCPPL